METISVYTVAKGDTLFGVARKFGMSVGDLKTLNRLISDNLSVGQTLRVRSSATPAPGPTPVPPMPTPTPAPQPPAPVFGNDYLANRRQFALEIRQDMGFQRYLLTVPLLNGGSVVANMRDNLTNSRFMMYPNGIMYAGQSHMALDVNTVQGVGLTLAQARALQYVSTHEGQFDAINSYDKAIFSYGFIQFTGSSAVGGSLNRLMESMELNAPSQFQRIFQQVGIDTENGETTVLNENGAKLRGDDAWLYIQHNVLLYGAFIQAGFDPMLVREQLRMANNLYVQPALNYRLNISAGGLQISIPRLGDILTSEASLTLMVALAINQGNGGMSRIFADAISRVATQSRLNDLGSLLQIDERLVGETISAFTTDERVRARAEGILNSGLSFV
ncbi:MAG: LysM peptidoglycan-binding domain-containing protein [Bacteroidota bacterium]